MGKKWFTLDRIVRNRIVSSFNCMWTNDRCLIELLVIHRNTWKDLTVLKKWTNARLKMFTRKCVYKSCFLYISMKRIWHGWYAIKPNQTVLISTLRRYREKKLLLLTAMAQRLECSPMARETWVQSQVESYQRL